MRVRCFLTALAVAATLAAPAEAQDSGHKRAPPASHGGGSAAQLRAKLQATQTEDGLRVRLSADTLFGDAPDALTDAATAVLGEIAKLITATRPHQILVAGHTDGNGADGENLKLSERRAHAVAAWLAEHAGRKPPRIVEQGYGRTRPIAPNRNPDGSDNPVGRTENRRIEIFLKR